MSIIRRLCAVLALSTALFYSCHVHISPYPSYDSGGDYSQQGGPSEFLWLTANGWVAVFTLVLTAVSIWQIILWRHANKTAQYALKAAKDAVVEAKNANVAAEKSNVQATRSNDVLIDAERGKLHFHGGSINHVGLIGWRLKNIGKTSIVLTQLGVNRTLMAATDLYPEKLTRPEHIGTINFHMDPGGYITNFEDAGAGIPRSHIMWGEGPFLDVGDLPKLGRTHVAFVQIWARYTTAFGIDYIFREVMVYDGTALSHLWQYSEDRPHMFLGQFASTVLNNDGMGKPRANRHLAD